MISEVLVVEVSVHVHASEIIVYRLTLILRAGDIYPSIKCLKEYCYKVDIKLKNRFC